MIGALIGWACVLLLGWLCWISVSGRPRSVLDGLGGLGQALPLGLILCGLLMLSVRSRIGFEIAAALLPGLGGLVLGLALLAYWRWRSSMPRSEVAARDKVPVWGWFLLGLIAVRFAYLLDEALLRPVFAWDAWNAWSLKAKTWFEMGQVNYVAADQWWTHAGSSGRTSLAWHYPELLSRIELGLAGAAGAWNENAIGVAWPLLWLALLVGCAQQWRALGADRNLTIVFTYVLASLPLLSVHAALAGYADLWVAVALTFAALSWMRWLTTRERGQLALALLWLLVLPQLKFEGAAWALLLASLMVAGEVPRRWRVVGAVVVAASVAAAIAVAWWWGANGIARVISAIASASGEQASVGVGSALQSFLRGMFGQYNWHLLWPLLLGVLAWRWHTLRSQRELLWLAALVMVGLVGVLGLFVLTPAAKWAQSDTAVNRLVLQWVPLVVSLIILLLRDRAEAGVPADKSHQSAP